MLRRAVAAVKMRLRHYLFDIYVIILFVTIFYFTLTLPRYLLLRARLPPRHARWR